MAATERSYLKARLWMAARKLDAEADVRTAVVEVNDRDGTNAEHAGTPEYASTRHLNDAQLRELAERFRARASEPPLRRARARRRGRADNVTVLVSREELHYLERLAGALVAAGVWRTQDALEGFMARQTRGRGIRTHVDASKLITPMESMLKKAGWSCSRDGRHFAAKVWVAPATKGTSE